jgi:ABC-type methionine transport system ATPase subunit
LVMVEHHEELARSIADRIWVIEDGCLKEEEV